MKPPLSGQLMMPVLNLSINTFFSLDVKYWVALNGTQWIYGTSLWPWFSLGWLGKCTTGFLWAQGHLQAALEPGPANLPSIPACWVQCFPMV